MSVGDFMIRSGDFQERPGVSKILIKGGYMFGCKGFYYPLVTPLYYGRTMQAPDVCGYCHIFSDHCNYYPGQIEEYQILALRRLLRHAQNHSPYYRRLFAEYGFDPERVYSQNDLKTLPVLTKETINEHREEMLADDCDTTARHETCTGGTSGAKMRFYRDNVCRSKRLALEWRSNRWTGARPHGKVAAIWPVTDDFVPRRSWKKRLADFFVTHSLTLSAGGTLDEATLWRFTDQILRFRPEIIRCFPSPAVALGEFIINKGIEIKGVKAVISTGEPLYLYQRTILEEAFNAKVFNLYASRETGPTAAECTAHGDLHLATDSVVVETVKDGLPVKSGESGEILLTDLHNYAMPFIRYAVGDYGTVLEESCSCGLPFPLLKNVVGRESDNFIDIDGNPISSISLSNYLIDIGPEVGQMQLIQESPTEVLVRLANNPPPTAEALAYYRDCLKRLVKGVKEVEFEIVDKILPEESGKYRFSICRVNKRPPNLTDKKATDKHAKSDKGL